MTRRSDLERHRRSLAEIREIMNSIKTLAYMETRKLARYMDAQHAVVKSIEDVAADFLSFHPDTLPAISATTSVYLLIGSERGFCGDFNHALLKDMVTALQQSGVESPVLIAVGRKLYSLLEKDERLAGAIDGASVVEEISTLLDTIVSEFDRLQQLHGALAVFCIYHGDDNQVLTQQILPPFQTLLNQKPQFSHPPVVNLSPSEFMTDLVDHYLYAILNQVLYTSLMMENHRRVAHLEGAVRHLDDKSEEMTRQSNALRQEEIIEEIEVILLSAASLQQDIENLKTNPGSAK